MTMSGNVVLVHGIFDTAKVFSTLQKGLEHEGFAVYAPSLSPNDGSASLSLLAAQLKKFIDRSVPERELFSIVGYSMGGLVARYYLQELGGSERATQLITLSSPHHGSLLAHLLNGDGYREMRRGSMFLKRLEARDDALSSLKITSLRTPFDLMVVPSRSSVWGRAENLSVPVPAHALMTRSKLVEREIVKRLRSDQPCGSAAEESIVKL